MSRFRKTCACLVFLFLVPGLTVVAQEVPSARSIQDKPDLKIQAESKIRSVIIFPDRATVVRSAEIKPVPGPQSVVFSGLPTTLIGSSLRATGRGTAEVKILGLESANEYLESPLLPEARKLQAEQEALQFEMNRTHNDLAVLAAQESFLMSIQSTQAAKASADLAQGKADPAVWEKTIEFLGAKLGALKNSQLDRQRILKEQDIKAESLKKRIDEIKPSKPREARKVTVLLEARTAGDFTLDLSYTVTNAKWTPLYMIRALPDSGEVELAVSGLIQQRSGENWEGVKASLSTSSPALESQPRELPPWILDIYVPRPVVRSESRAASSSRGDGGAEDRMRMAEMASAPSPPPPPREAEIETAAVTDTGIHLNFDIRRAIDVPSDGAPHKFPIDNPSLKIKFDYSAVPKGREAAFLRGTLTNTLAYPLLPGGADLFINQDFVGATQLPLVAAGEETRMFFGEDGQIKVRTEQVKREKTGGGFLSKTEKLRLVTRITVQNLRRTPVEIEVTDRLPVSQNSKIEVRDVLLQPAPGKRDDQGLLTWTLSLAPQEKKEILIDWTVEYPRDATITGW